MQLDSMAEKKLMKNSFENEKDLTLTTETSECVIRDLSQKFHPIIYITRS